MKTQLEFAPKVGEIKDVYLPKRTNWGHEGKLSSYPR